MSKDFEDDDLGLDDDEFGEFDFGDMDGEGLSEEPPKNKREAVTRSLTKAGSSFVDDFKDDGLQTATEIAKNAIPDSLSKETGLVVDIHDTVKDEISEAMSSVKKEATSTFNMVKKLVPADNDKINGVLNKIGDVLGLSDESSTSSGPSKEQILLESIKGEIASSMGDSKTTEDREQLLKDQIEQNRHKTQAELANMSLSNLDRIRKFNYEITNTYYRKNLEIQLKTLYVQKESLEVTKAGFDTFKNQFESIILNTSLPDIVKTRNSEVLIQQMKLRAMNDGMKAITDITPISAFKKNFKEKVGNLRDTAIDSLGGVNAVLEAGGEDSISKEQMLAMLASGYVKEKLGKFIGSKVEKTDIGKEAIRNIKAKGGDVESILKAKAMDAGGGKVSDILFGLSDMFNTKERKGFTLAKQDINTAISFDKRAHTSIIKIIPGLLSKIYSELKSTRMKDNNPSSHELYYDTKTDKFNTGSETVNAMNSSYKSKLEKGLGINVAKFISALSNYGGLELNSLDSKTIRKALITYVVVDKGSQSLDGLIGNLSKSKYLPKHLQTPVKKALGKLKRHDSTDGIDIVNDALVGIWKSSVKVNMKDEITELDNMGYSGLIDEMGIMKKDPVTKNYTSDNDLLNKKLLKVTESLSDKEINIALEEERKRKEEEEKASKNKKFSGGYVPGYAKGGYVKKPKLKDVRKEIAAGYNLRKSHYTGDGGKTKVAGITHKGEFVLTKASVTKLIQDTAEGTFGSSKKMITDIVNEVSKNTKDLKVKDDAIKAMRNIRETSKDNLNIAKTGTKSVANKLMYSKLSKANKRIVDKHYKSMKKLTGTNISFAEYLASDNSTTVMKQLTVDISKKAYKQVRDNISYAGNSIKDNLNIAKESIIRNMSNKKYEGIDFLKKLSDYNTVEQANLRAEYFGSVEYKENKDLTFADWLAHSKQIDPETNFWLDKVSKKLNPLSKKITALGKLKDEMIDEVMGKITGTGLKDLTLDEEKSLREEFFKTPEYKNRYVTDFDEWLKTFGYRRNGTGVFGRLKKSFSIKNILKKTRALDKKIAKFGVKTAWKGVKFGAKLPWYGLRYGVPGAVKGAYNVGKHPVGGVMSALNSGVKATTGMSLHKDDWKTNKTKVSKLFKGQYKDENTEASKIAEEKHDSGMGWFKKYIYGKTLQEKRDKVKRDKAEKAKKRKGLFDRDGDGDRDGNWKDRLKAFGKKKKETVKTKTKVKGKSIFGLLGKFLPILLGIGTMAAKMFGGITSIVSGVGKLGGFIVKGIGKSILGIGSIVAKPLLGLGKIIAKGVGKYILGIGKVVAKPLVGLGKIIAKPLIGLGSIVAKPLLGLGKIIAKPLIGLGGVIGSALSKPLGSITSAVMSIGKSIVSGIGGALSSLGTKLSSAFKVKPKVTKPSIAKPKLVSKSTVVKPKVTKFSTVKPIGAKPSIPKPTMLKPNVVKPSKIDIVKSTKSKIPKGKVDATLANKLKSYVSRIQGKVIKKFGKKAGGVMLAKLTAKVGARFVPIVGQALLAYSVVEIGYYIAKGYGVDGAISMHLLGVDIFADDAVVTDEHGDVIKPDTPKDKSDIDESLHNPDGSNKYDDDDYLNIEMRNANETPEERKQRRVKRRVARANAIKNKAAKELAITKSKEHKVSELYKLNKDIAKPKPSTVNTVNKPANNFDYKNTKPVSIRSFLNKTKPIPTDKTLYGNEDGDGVNKEQRISKPTSSKANKANGRGGELVTHEGGFNKLSLGRGVRVDGFKPSFAKNLASMANEYNILTGKKLPINSGYRSYADQLALKKKYGAKAATPGKSMHEFGLAFDTNTTNANELDKLGLMKKYGFTRPVGKETWHVESAGTQLAVNTSKKDPEVADQLVAASVGRGGLGWGTLPNVRKYSRNKKYQESILAQPVDTTSTKPANNIDTTVTKYVKNDIGKKPITDKPRRTVNNRHPKTTNVKPTNKPTNKPRGRRGHAGNISKKDKPIIDKHQKEISANAAKTAAATADSVSVQKQMLNFLGDIADKLGGGLNINNLNDIPQPIINTSTEAKVETKQPERKENLPNPTVNISRKRYAS